ncbi:TPA: hypothetical protein QCX20_002383 [Bacillus toyonensis]|nr:hypothetical protein [Bacillus toyonensis]
MEVKNRKNFKIKYYPSQVTNLAKRHVLEGIGHLIMYDLGQEWPEWDEIKEAFGNKCCYCEQKEEEGKKLTQEHLQMIKDNGLHHVGNVVPACGECNSKRKKIGWEEFLKDTCNDERHIYQKRLKRIKNHMKKHEFDKALKHPLAENLDVFMTVFPDFLEQNLKSWLNSWTDPVISKTPRGNLSLEVEVMDKTSGKVGTVKGGYKENQPIPTEFVKTIEGFEEDERVIEAKHFVEMIVESYDTASKLE